MYQTFPTSISVHSKSAASKQLIESFRSSVIRENLQFMNEELSKVKECSKKIKAVISKVQENKVGCEQTIRNLNAEIKDLDQKINGYISKSTGVKVEEQYKANIRSLTNDYLAICKERVNVATSLDIKSLKKIDIEDKKSQANEVFKWILGSIYNEPPSKYFWPNFKQQAFQHDGGFDFIQRMGKVPAKNLKEEQKIYTDHFLSKYEQIAAAPQLTKQQTELAKFKQLAQLFKKGYLTSSQITDNEKLIEKTKQTTLEQDEEFVRWKARSEAIKDRLKLNQDYLGMLNNLQNKLSPKCTSYDDRAENGAKAYSSLHSFDKWNPSIKMDTEHKSSNWNCCN